MKNYAPQIFHRLLEFFVGGHFFMYCFQLKTNINKNVRVLDFPSVSLISTEFRTEINSYPCLCFTPQNSPQFPSFPQNFHTEINSFPCLSFFRRISLVSLISAGFPYRINSFSCLSFPQNCPLVSLNSIQK